MKEFNLEEAKAGKPVCTRDGKPVRIICFDRRDVTYPIIALVGRDSDYVEDLRSYTSDGKVYGAKGEDCLDLMMVGVKKKGWINIYKPASDCTINRYGNIGVYHSKEDAITNKLHRSDLRYVDTIEIEWEE